MINSDDPGRAATAEGGRYKKGIFCLHFRPKVRTLFAYVSEYNDLHNSNLWSKGFKMNAIVKSIRYLQ